MERRYGYLAQRARGVKKARSRTQSCRVEDDGLLEPAPKISRTNSEDDERTLQFAIEASVSREVGNDHLVLKPECLGGICETRTEVPKLTTATPSLHSARIRSESHSQSRSRSRSSRSSNDFRMKYYRTLGVTSAFLPAPLTTHENRVTIGNRVAREDFDWNCESPTIGPDERLLNPPLSPLRADSLDGIFELEEDR